MNPDRLVAALRAALRDHVPVTVDDDGAQNPAAAEDIGLKIGDHEVSVAWLPIGWPKQVQRLADRPRRPDLIGAAEMSPGAQRTARNAGIGWFDETGAADIAVGPIVIQRDGDRRRLDTNLGWRPGTLAVCEALLTGTSATVAALRERTGLASGTAADALNFLSDQRLLTSSAGRGRNSGRSVIDPHALLDTYAVAAQRLRSPVTVRVGVLWRDLATGVSEVGKRWSAAGVSWSATGALSAHVLAPFLTEASPMEVYVEGTSRAQLRLAAATAGLSEASGGRLLLRPFPTPAGDSLSTEIRSHFWSVPWPRVFADLRVTGVRGEDAADHLREVCET